jgi:hypothetical protein
MDVQDHEMNLIGQDLVGYALDLLAQVTDEENGAKLHLGQVFGDCCTSCAGRQSTVVRTTGQLVGQ